MKKIKSIIAVVLTLVLVFSLTGCGEIKKAETSVNGMFTAFKNLDFEEAQKYVNVDDITNGENSNDNAEAVMNAIFGNLNYEIVLSEKVDDSTVIVKTSITANRIALFLKSFSSVTRR